MNDEQPTSTIGFKEKAGCFGCLGIIMFAIASLLFTPLGALGLFALLALSTPPILFATWIISKTSGMPFEVLFKPIRIRDEKLISQKKQEVMVLSAIFIVLWFVGLYQLIMLVLPHSP